MLDIDVTITTQGHVPDTFRRYAEEKVARAANISPRPILFARVALTEIENPSVERRAVAKASLDVSGRLVRAHVAAETMNEAIDRLADRLERRLEILSEHDEAERQETGLVEPGEWRHGNLPTHRPAYYPRPAAECEVVRHKTYELGALTPKEAALDMELLDFDFYLFTNADTGREAVVYRTEGRTLALVESGPEETAAEAAERLDFAAGPFVFFVDPVTGRGNVLYRRYDGNYGLITPA